MARTRAPTVHTFEAIEASLRQAGCLMLAGVDEVGRGCLAGAVVAAAVVLPEGYALPGLNDSKKLSASQREVLAARIWADAVAVGVGEGSVEEIAEMNILRASLLAMRRAILALDVQLDHLLIDGNQKVDLPIPQTTVVKGDSRCASIAAASIVAKVHRDASIAKADLTWPGYGFQVHKGYGTEQHREAIARLGPCPIHRRTFRGVAEYWPAPVIEACGPGAPALGERTVCVAEDGLGLPTVAPVTVPNNNAEPSTAEGAVGRGGQLSLFQGRG